GAGGGNDAGGDADEGGQQHRQHRQLCGGGQPAQELFHHRATGTDGITQVQLDGAAQPAEVLDVDRIVQAQLLPEQLVLFGGCVLAQHQQGGIAGGQVEQR